MSLICFRNGSLAREAVRDRYGLDWAGFEDALRVDSAWQRWVHDAALVRARDRAPGGNAPRRTDWAG